MIEIKGLRKTYHGKVILQDINLRVSNGEVVGLIGRNGEGKSTLLNCLVGLTRPDVGEITIDAFDWKKDPLSCKKNIGATLSEHTQLVNELDGYTYLKMIGKLRKIPAKEIDLLITKLTEYFFNSSGEINQPIAQFSTGMKKKLEFCAAVLHNPTNLVLDEPFENLDVVTCEAVVQLIRDFCQQGNKSVLLTSHILANLEKICTHLLILDHTRIVLNETIDFFRSENQSLEPYVLSILKGETSPKQALWK